MAEPAAPTPTLLELQQSFAAIAVRRGGEAALAERLRAGFGLDLPAAGRWAGAGALCLAWTGPGSWLLVGEQPDLAEKLEPALGDAAGVIDLSDARATFRMSGPQAGPALARLVPLDLHPSVFAAGQCANTVAAHIPVQLIQRNDAPSYDLSCARSYAGSLRQAVRDALRF